MTMSVSLYRYRYIHYNGVRGGGVGESCRNLSFVCFFFLKNSYGRKRNDGKSAKLLLNTGYIIMYIISRIRRGFCRL